MSEPSSWDMDDDSPVWGDEPLEVRAADFPQAERRDEGHPQRQDPGRERELAVGQAHEPQLLQRQQQPPRGRPVQAGDLGDLAQAHPRPVGAEAPAARPARGPATRRSRVLHHDRPCPFALRIALSMSALDSATFARASYCQAPLCVHPRPHRRADFRDIKGGAVP